MDKVIAWTVNSSDNLNNTFAWEDVKISKRKDYYITNEIVDGFNFLYICLPKNTKFTIYNSLNLVLFDSSLPENGQLFTTIFKDNEYLILRKKDVYNTRNPVTFKITIYND